MLCCLLVNTPILAFPTFKKHFILDASDSGVGAVSCQVDEDRRERVIVYGSRSLSQVEYHYCVTRR